MDALPNGSPPARDGYVTDVPYGLTFTREAMPEWLDFVATLCGVAAPLRDREIRWCDAGCGMGMTAAIAAATHPDIDVHAIDFMPEHIGFARTLRDRAGISNLTLHAAAFDDVALDALPKFEYIVAHGVYSWVEPRVRAQLRTFIDRHLAPGGFVYVSYNAMPSWAADLPLGRLLRELSLAASGDSNARFSAAANFAADMTEAGARGLVDSPRARSGLARRRNAAADVFYPHEYLPAGWEPRYVTDVRAEFAEHELLPVASAIVRDNFDSYTLTSRARRLLAGVPDPNLRELLRDYFRGTPFRRDVFSRGFRRLDDTTKRTQLAQATLMLCSDPHNVPYAMQTPAGTVRFDTPSARSIVAALTDGPRALSELDDRANSGEDLLAGALALCAAGFVRPVSPVGVDTARIDGAIAELAASRGFPYRVSGYGTALAR